MSTKSDILYGHEGKHRIYEETSQPQYILNIFKGFDIEVILDRSIIRALTIDGELLIVNFTVDSEIYETMPMITLWFGSITQFEMDEEDLMITVKGGSHTAQKILKGEWY